MRYMQVLMQLLLTFTHVAAPRAETVEGSFVEDEDQIMVLPFLGVNVAAAGLLSQFCLLFKEPPLL